jgi:hypothetical protein
LGETSIPVLREAQTQRIRLTRRVVVAAAVLMLVGAVWVGNTIASDPNVKAAQAVAVDTLVLEHTFGDPDVAHPTFTKADVPRLRVQADALARSHYVGTLLATRIHDFLNVVDVMESGELTLIDGGVKDVSFISTDVNADIATVVLRATVWSSVLTRDGITANPMSTNVWTLKLAKVGPKWFVTTVDSDFRG